MTVPEMTRGTKPKPHRTQSGEAARRDGQSCQQHDPHRSRQGGEHRAEQEEARGTADAAAKASEETVRTGCGCRS